MWLVSPATAIAAILMAMPGETIAFGANIYLVNGVAYNTSPTAATGVALQSGSPGGGAIQVQIADKSEQYGTWATQLVDSAGTNKASIDATGALKITGSTDIAGAVSVSNFPATQPVSGTVSISNLPVTQPVSGTFWQATQPVSVASLPSVTVSNFPSSQAVTGTFWQTTQPVSGTVSVGNFPATQPVSGTFWQSTQPVSLSTVPALAAGSATIGGVKLIDTGGSNVGSISATGALKVDNSAVTQPVSGTFWQATQPVSGSVSVSNFPASQAVTGAFYQATQPVSIASMPSTPVTGTFYQATQPVSGTFYQATQPVSIASMPSTPVTGTFWQATQPVSDATLGLAQASTTSGQGGPLVQGAVTTAAPAYTTAKTNPLSLTTTGLLRVDGSGVTQPVSGTFWPATQPVSGTFWQATQPVSGTFWQATQPVSGTVTANAAQAGTAVSTSASLFVQQNESRTTYFCDTGTYTTATSPTDCFTLQGSGTKTIRIVAIYAITAATLPSIIRRSTADTAGTSSAGTISKYDSGDGAATAACLKYTVNPTALGTTAATFVSQQAAASATNPLWQAQTYQKPIYIRGTGEYLVLNGGPSAGSVRFVIIWTEE